MRAFIAIDIPATPGLVEASEALRATGVPLKPVDLGIIHLTLKFLGEIPEGRVPEIVGVMRTASAQVAPQTLHLRGMGGFPGPRRVRVVWVGVEPREPLIAVARGLEEGCAQLGFPREDRPFTPHVTLARLRVPQRSEALERVIEAHGERDFGSFRVEGIALKRSILKPQGPEYEVVAQVPLGQPAG